MEALITVLPGDGIGPEVCDAGVNVLNAVAEKHGHTFNCREQLIGGIAIDETGNPFPPETRAAAEQCDAILLGAVGGPKWSDPNAPVRPEQGLLEMRAALGVFANLRPVQIIDPRRRVTHQGRPSRRRGHHRRARTDRRYLFR
jgi:3-isopropylmalate dehydrogenase